VYYQGHLSEGESGGLDWKGHLAYGVMRVTPGIRRGSKAET